jgi:16S rRNA U516 pseudouridylate synthase RsuA-like enzyme
MPSRTPAALRRAGAGHRGRRRDAAREVGALLRSGGKHAWLEIVLDEGRNRQIRRLLAARGYRCCAWCAWRSARCSWARWPRAPGAGSTRRKSPRSRD